MILWNKFRRRKELHFTTNKLMMMTLKLRQENTWCWRTISPSWNLEKNSLSCLSLKINQLSFCRNKIPNSQPGNMKFLNINFWRFLRMMIFQNLREKQQSMLGRRSMNGQHYWILQFLTMMKSCMHGMNLMMKMILVTSRLAISIQLKNQSFPVMILQMIKVRKMMTQLLMNLRMNLKNAIMVLKTLQKQLSVETSDRMI